MTDAEVRPLDLVEITHTRRTRKHSLGLPCTPTCQHPSYPSAAVTQPIRACSGQYSTNVSHAVRVCSHGSRTCGPSCAPSPTFPARRPHLLGMTEKQTQISPSPIHKELWLAQRTSRSVRSLGCGGARPTRHTTRMALHDAWRLHRPSPSYFLYFAISAVPFGAPIILAPFGTRRADAVVQHGAARWRHGTGLFAPTRHPWLKALCRMCAPLRPCSNSHIAGGDDVVLAYACAIAALRRRAAVGGPQCC